VLVRQEGLGMIKNVSQVFIDDKMVSRLCDKHNCNNLTNITKGNVGKIIAVKYTIDDEDYSYIAMVKVIKDIDIDIEIDR